MKKIKGKTAIPPDAGRQTKPAAPPAGARVRAAEAHVVSRQGGPVKTDRMPKLAKDREGQVKPPVPAGATKAPRERGTFVELANQRPKRASGGSTTAKEQYIRLRVRVRDGHLSVIDSHLVDGPLSQPRSFSGSNAYDLTLDDRLLAAGDLPDLGVQRSFVNPNPKAPKEERGHHFSERGVFEFTARVPAAEVTPETIGRITLRLYRVKEATGADRLEAMSLGRQFERQMRPIAELKGLPEPALPAAIEKRGGRTPGI
jgi:hypothetical protein